MTHQVLSFPQQALSPAELQQFSARFGSWGNDPFVTHMPAHPHVLEVRREPQESVIPFGATWHSDWSFQAAPPSATFLHAQEVPPIGGQTLFADGYRAFESLPVALQDTVQQLTAIHSARRPYSPEGFAASGGYARSMRIRPDSSARQTRDHPVVRTHPETGRKALWVNPVYTVGIRDLHEADAARLLATLFAHGTRDEFVYVHHWQRHTLCLWDNRCTLHRATGGYDGHRRVMHRTVLAGDVPIGPVPE